MVLGAALHPKRPSLGVLSTPGTGGKGLVWKINTDGQSPRKGPYSPCSATDPGVTAHAACCLYRMASGRVLLSEIEIFHLRKWWVSFSHSHKCTVPRHPLQPARDVVILGALHPFPPPQFIFTMLSFAIKARDFLCHSVQAVQRSPVRFFFLFLGVTFVLRPADAVPVPVIPADPTLGSGRGRQGGGRGGSWRKGSASLGAHPAPSRGLRSFLWGHFSGAGCPEPSKRPTSKKMPFKKNFFFFFASTWKRVSGLLLFPPAPRPL